MPVDLTDSETAIVEGTPYEHDEYGRVEVLLVTDMAVTFETGDRVGGVPETIREPEHDFRRAATPAPQTLGVPASTISAPTNTPE